MSECAISPAISCGTAITFFSSFAQIWASLVAFGGFFLMARSDKYEKQMQEYYKSCLEYLNLIYPHISSAQIAYPPPEVHIIRNKFEEYMESILPDVDRQIKDPDSSLLKPMLMQVKSLVLNYEFYKNRSGLRKVIDSVVSSMIINGGILTLCGLLGVLFTERIFINNSCLFCICVLLLLTLSIYVFIEICRGFTDDGTKEIT